MPQSRPARRATPRGSRSARSPRPPLSAATNPPRRRQGSRQGVGSSFGETGFLQTLDITVEIFAVHRRHWLAQEAYREAGPLSEEFLNDHRASSMQPSWAKAAASAASRREVRLDL